MSKISKLDAARRQLETAINLFFRDADAVAIHSLAFAAHRVLVDICRTTGKDSILKGDWILEKLGKDKRSEWLGMINEAANFLRHAEDDPSEFLNFDPSSNDIFLLDSVEMYMQLASEAPSLLAAFRCWFLMKYPDLLSDEVRQKALANPAAKVLRPENKAAFLDFAHTIEGSRYGVSERV